VNIGGGTIEGLEDLPPLCHAVFSILLIRKTWFYAMATNEEAFALVSSIRQGQQDYVKRKMVYAEHVQCPRVWE